MKEKIILLVEDRRYSKLIKDLPWIAERFGVTLEEESA